MSRQGRRYACVNVNISNPNTLMESLSKKLEEDLTTNEKKMLAVLERVMSGNVQSIVVTYKDRLFRFGFDLLEWFCAHHNVRIVVLNKVELSPVCAAFRLRSIPKERKREMVEDILSILHCFSARLYGLRLRSIPKEKYSSQISAYQDLYHVR
ncbi:hypothetical protein [Okeania sp. SIO1I7]|uniref:hypothetical protein n=1 Tax=Okeania sp. SIO1I7 TaxID=2607772 RepID=UPI0013F9C422|nr:hypothetical protein [Okeania sp. SIO1I7]NET28811.1 hypothetical protein [Okeania sp. SIO1I7]